MNNILKSAIVSSPGSGADLVGTGLFSTSGVYQVQLLLSSSVAREVNVQHLAQDGTTIRFEQRFYLDANDPVAVMLTWPVYNQEQIKVKNGTVTTGVVSAGIIANG